MGKDADKTDWTPEKVMKLAREGREKFSAATSPDEQGTPLETELWFQIGVFVKSDRSADYETILREAVLDFKSRVQAATREECAQWHDDRIAHYKELCEGATKIGERKFNLLIKEHRRSAYGIRQLGKDSTDEG